MGYIAQQVEEHLNRLYVGGRKAQYRLERIAALWAGARTGRSRWRRHPPVPPSPQGCATVAEYLHHPNPHLRMCAIRTLRVALPMSAIHQNDVAACLEDPWVPTQLQSVRFLGECNATEILLEQLDSTVWAKGWIAARHLALTHRTQIIDHLRRTASDHIEWARAANALRPCPPDLQQRIARFDRSLL
ncbi:MAG: hypothetical protein AAFV53_25130 [Myxococcota bacterium]